MRIVQRLFASLLLLAGLATTAGCVYDETHEPGPEQTMGMRPIYISVSDIENIDFEAPRSLNRPGKIYAYGNLLLINELGKGIHVFDNFDPANPTNLGFIHIEGNLDLAVRNGILYADNVTDLVSINISTLPQGISVVGRTPDVFDINEAATVPADYTGYFECVDNSKGLIVGWEEAELSFPQCYATF